MEEPLSQTNDPQSQTTHKRLQIIGVGLLAIIGIMVVFFMGLVGYYLWIQTFGETEKQQALADQFSSRFTQASKNDTGSSLQADQPINTVIRPHDPTFGNPDATVTVVMFIDFQCPFSQESFPIFEQIMNTYEPAIRVVFKHFPLQSIHAQALDAAIAGQCAQEQKKFWPYYTLLFEQRKFAQADLISYAERLGLDLPVFTQCFSQGRIESLIGEDLNDGVTVGVRGTPTYFVNQTKVEGVIDKDTWDKLIITSLQQ